MTEAPAGYDVSHYEKEGASYTAVPRSVSRAEEQMVETIRNASYNIGQLRAALGLPEEPVLPQAIDGYFPLYTNEVDSNAASSNGESHEHEINGITYYMPDEGVTLYHGNYEAGDSGY